MQSVALLALVAATVSAQATPAQPRPAANRAAAVAAPGKAVPLTAAALEIKIVAAAVAGKYSDALAGLFLQYADLRAREKLVPKVVSEEFWTWLAANKVLHKAVLVTQHPQYDGAAVARLAELQAAFAVEVDKYPHLALAFALDYAAAGGTPISAGWSRKPIEGGPPTMAESFGYYVKNARRMIYPSDKVPWPLLALVADNDLPLAERAWAVERYGKTPPENFGKIYHDVFYDYAGLRKAADQSGLAVNEGPYTLVNIFAKGGVCADRAYYASRVLKSLGVPAAYDRGAGTRGGHAWVAWISVAKGQFGLADSGRFDLDKYYTGLVSSPLSRRDILDRDVELLAAGMNTSYDGYIDTIIACHAYRMCVAPGDRAKAALLLKDALARRNPYSASAWRLLGAAVADGTLPQKEGETLWSQMSGPFAAYPDLTFHFLQDILTPRLDASDKPGEAEVKTNLALLDRAFALYEKAARPDLAVALRLLQGKYLEAAGLPDKALGLYVAASQQYVKAHFGFVPLFSRAMTLLAAPEHQKLRMKYIDYMATNVPEYMGDPASPARSVNPAYILVARVYAAVLKESGDEKKAAEWEAKAAQKS